MMFMNRFDIEEAYMRYMGQSPVLSDAVRILKTLMDETDAHSDGWAYWSKPVQAAKKLQELIQAGTAGKPTPAKLRAACAPIKSFYTRHGKKAGMQEPRWP